MSRRVDEVRGQLDFPTGYEEDYEPTPIELGARLARQMLEHLFAVGLDELPTAPPGLCDDCREDAIWSKSAASVAGLVERERVRFGAFAVCRKCAQQRLNVRKKAA